MLNRLFEMQVRLSPHEERHQFLGARLVMVLQGQVKAVVGEQETLLNREDILFIDTEQPHALTDEGKDSLICQVRFAPEALLYLHNVICDSTRIDDPAAFLRIRNTFKLLLQDRLSGAGPDSYLLQSQCFRLLHILESWFNGKAPEGDQQQVLRRYILEHFREEISLSQMAEDLHFSTAYLSRLFKKQFGQNFLTYLNHLRLERAAVELRETDRNVTAIAMNQGFSSISSFYKLFRDTYGMQPSEYRKQEIEKRSDEQRIGIGKKTEQYVREYLQVQQPEPEIAPGTEKVIEADISQPLKPAASLTKILNIGPVGYIQRQNMTNAVLKSRKEHGIRLLRASVKIPGDESSEIFRDVEQMLVFCQSEGLEPFLVFQTEDVLYMDPRLLQNVLSEMVQRMARYYSSDLPVYIELGIGNTADDQGITEDYFRIFTIFRDTLMQFFPRVLMGGCSASLLDYAGREKELLYAWLDADVRPDFLTIRLIPAAHRADGSIRMLSDENCLKDALERFFRSRIQTGLKQIPVYAVEYSAFPNSNCYYNDSRWAACFTARLYIDCIGRIEGLGTLPLIDEKPPEALRLQQFFGGNGMISWFGIKKSTYILLRSLRTMDEGLIGVDEGYLVSKVTSKRLRLFLFNYKHLNPLFFLKTAEGIPPQDLLLYVDNLENQSYKIHLSGLADGHYQINIYTISDQQGSPFDVWVVKGCPKLDGLFNVFFQNYESPDVSTREVTVREGQLDIEYTLKPLDFMGMSIIYTGAS